MGYEAQKTTVLLEVEKGTRGDKIVVAKLVGEKTGNENIDIRMYYSDKDSGELKPTSKGVRFSTESTLDIVKALVSTLSDLEKEELGIVSKE